ncbi:MAG TPA: hypothetical protein VMU89_09340 [Thermomicrobiaceae bacterium]|nr:hypothetical protein [Thermomicrobiaceae bacterium]
MNVVEIVVPIVVVLIAFGAWWWRNLRGSAAERALRAQRRAARRALARIEHQHLAALSLATKNLRAAEQAHTAGVSRAQASLVASEHPTGRRLAQYRGVTLYERVIHTPNGSAAVIGAKATVDSAGNMAVTQRHTVTRFMAGGAVLGPVGAVGSVFFPKKKRHDTRELYLLIETDQYSTVVQCKPEEGAVARNFAAQVNTAALQSRRMDSDRPVVIQAARHALEKASADTASIDQCRVALQRVEQDQVYAAEAAKAHAVVAALKPPQPRRQTTG